MILSLRPNPELSDDAADWFVGRLEKYAIECGTGAVDAAIDKCLEESRFRPDPADIKAALGLTDKQQEKASQDSGLVSAAAAWHTTFAWLHRYMERDVEGRWKRVQKPVRILRDEKGMPIFTEQDGRRAVKTVALDVPELDPQAAWCVEQIGGAVRLLECEEGYVEVVRRDFLKAWPLYGTAEVALLETGAGDYVDVDRMIADGLARRNMSPPPAAEDVEVAA